MSKALGISNSYLSEIERGKKNVSIDLLNRYADIFGVRVSSLMRFSEEYDCAAKDGNGQQFITNLMSKLIEAYSVDR